MKKSFTIAEVLITIGIIGIIAAIIIPGLMAKHKRKIAETKLAKFYSVMNQALRMSIAEHGEILIDNTNKSDTSNSEYIEKWYKENITKYIKTIHEEGSDKNNAYYKVAFIDGSGFNSFMSTSSPTSGKSILYIMYCLDYQICKNGNYDGKNQFLFLYNPETQQVLPIFRGYSINILKNGCYSENAGSRHYCAALIEANGWKIPDDYPWIK